MKRLFWVASLLVLFCSCQSVSTRQIATEYRILGDAYLGLSKYEEAKKYYLKSASYYNDLSLQYNLAQAYINLGEFDQAMALLDPLLVRDPDNLMLLELNALIAYQKDELDKALDLYNQILGKDSLYSRALFNKGLIYEEREEWQKSYSAFFDLNSIEPSLDVGLRLGALLNRLDKKQKAIATYESLERTYGFSKEVGEPLLSLYRDSKQYDKALELLDKLILIDKPNTDYLYTKLTLLLVDLKDYSGGYLFFRSLVFNEDLDFNRLKASVDKVEKPFQGDFVKLLDQVGS